MEEPTGVETEYIYIYLAAYLVLVSYAATHPRCHEYMILPLYIFSVSFL